MLAIFDILGIRRCWASGIRQWCRVELWHRSSAIATPQRTLVRPLHLHFLQGPRRAEHFSIRSI